MTLANLTKLLILIGLIGTLGFSFHAGEPGNPAWWKSAIPVLLALVVPFLLYWLMQAKMIHHPFQQWLLLLSVAVYSLGGLALMYRALVQEADAQAGLIMVVIPVYGAVLIVLTALILAITRNAGNP